MIVEGMIEGTHSRGRPRTKFISQIIIDIGDTSYKKLKDMANDSVKWKKHLL